MKTRENLQHLMLEKAMKDPDFRTSLTKYPKETIEKEIGVKIPESIRIRVMEETKDTFFLVLPPAQGTNKEDELTERELKSVAAGGNEWYDKFGDAVHSWLTCAC